MRYYLVQLIGACQYMHGENVIHRDLKLGNIFLDSRMDIKVGDFGLAALIEKEGERKKCVLSIAVISGRSESSETDNPAFCLPASQDHLRNTQLHRSRGSLRYSQRTQL